MPARLLAYARQHWLLLVANGVISLTVGFVVAAAVTR